MKKNYFIGILLALLAVAGFFLYRYGETRTPEYALAQVAHALRTRDGALLAEYVDTERVAANAYDDATALLVRDIASLHGQYPADVFFWHTDEFMRDYIAQRRESDLALIHAAARQYFAPHEAGASGSEEDAPGQIAGEAEKFMADYDMTYQDVEVDGDKAIANFLVSGHDTPYGQLLPRFVLAVELERGAEHWRITRIANADALFPPIVHAVEMYWDMMGWQ